MRASSARLGRRRPESMGYGRFVSQTVVEDSGWEPNGVTHPVRFYEGGGCRKSGAPIRAMKSGNADGAKGCRFEITNEGDMARH